MYSLSDLLEHCSNLLRVFFSCLNGGRCVRIVNGILMMRQESKNVSMAIQEMSTKITGDRLQNMGEEYWEERRTPRTQNL